MSLFCLDLKLISTCVLGSVYCKFLVSLNTFRFILLPIYLYLSTSIYIYLHLSISIYIYIYLYLSISIFIYLNLYLSLSIHLSICLSVCLSGYLPTYLSSCLSVCQQVAATWCHSSMSSLPFVIGLGVCLTLLLVAWPCVALLFACNFVPLCCDALI